MTSASEAEIQQTPGPEENDVLENNFGQMQDPGTDPTDSDSDTGKPLEGDYCTWEECMHDKSLHQQAPCMNCQGVLVTCEICKDKTIGRVTHCADGCWCPEPVGMETDNFEVIIIDGNKTGVEGNEAHEQEMAVVELVPPRAVENGKTTGDMSDSSVEVFDLDLTSDESDASLED